MVDCIKTSHLQILPQATLLNTSLNINLILTLFALPLFVAAALVPGKYEIFEPTGAQHLGTVVVSNPLVLYPKTVGPYTVRRITFTPLHPVWDNV